MFQEIKKEIESYGFNIDSLDFERPWGGFLVIDESQAQDFSNKFFKGLDFHTLKIGGKLSPKIFNCNSSIKIILAISQQASRNLADI
jgi:mannose-6-phosphate isomerase